MINPHGDSLTLFSDEDITGLVENKDVAATRWLQWMRQENKYTDQDVFFTRVAYFHAMIGVVVLVFLFQAPGSASWVAFSFVLAFFLGDLGLKARARRHLTIVKSNMRKVSAIVPDIEAQLFLPPMSREENLILDARRSRD